MISFLRGKIVRKKTNYLILEVANIGYQVFLSDCLLNDLKLNSEIELHIFHQVKEDINDLYGFKEAADLDLFELLISVSGIGPKTALGILNIASVDDLKIAIANGDASSLTKVSGIGKKTAERLVLELGGKITKLIDGQNLSYSSGASSDEIEALISLGYSLNEAREALKGIDKSITDSAQRLKIALKKMRTKA